MNTLRMGLLQGEITPFRVGISLKVATIVGADNLRMALKQENQSPARRANVNRLPEAIENQNRLS